MSAGMTKTYPEKYISSQFRTLCSEYHSGWLQTHTTWHKRSSRVKDKYRSIPQRCHDGTYGTFPPGMDTFGAVARGCLGSFMIFSIFFLAFSGSYIRKCTCGSRRLITCRLIWTLCRSGDVYPLVFRWQTQVRRQALVCSRDEISWYQSLCCHHTSPRNICFACRNVPILGYAWLLHGKTCKKWM